MASDNGLFPAFFAVAAIVGIGSTAFLYLSRDPAQKRTVLQASHIGGGVLMIAAMWTMDFPPPVILVTVPALALITMLNLRAVRFCGSCGATLTNQNPFSRPKFCSGCGAPLSGK